MDENTVRNLPECDLSAPKRRTQQPQVGSRVETRADPSVDASSSADATSETSALEASTRGHARHVSLSPPHRPSGAEPWDEAAYRLVHATRLYTLGEMVAGVAHELSQPLCTISNFATACEAALDVPAAAGADVGTLDAATHQQLVVWLRAIAAEAQRSGQIVDRLRSYLRGAETARSSHELRDLIRDAIELVALECRTYEVAVHYAASSPSCPIVVDSVQMQQVIVNVLRNALDAVEHAEDPAVGLETQVDPHAVQIRVWDHGRGCRGDLDGLFAPFVTSKHEGLGMGLAIARKIVTDHDGRIWATRNQGSGLTFHIEIPRTRKEMSV